MMEKIYSPPSPWEIAPPANGVVLVPDETSFVPRTSLGKRLYELRMSALRSGMKTLSDDEILDAIRRNRGDHE